jgi:hypothetical protein
LEALHTDVVGLRLDVMELRHDVTGLRGDVAKLRANMRLFIDLVRPLVPGGVPPRADRGDGASG